MRLASFQWLLSLVVFLCVWQIVAWVWSQPLLFPSVPATFTTILGLLADGELLLHVGASLKRLAMGMAIGVPLGAVIGCAMGKWTLVDRALNPYLRMANSIPAIALIPFSLMWFGVTEIARVSLEVYIITLTVTLSARDGIRRIPEIHKRIAQNLGLSPVAAFFQVEIPSSFPWLLAGIRSAIGLGVMVVVAAEMLGATNGLGYLIMQGRFHYNPDIVFAGIIGLGLLAWFLDRGFEFVIEDLSPRWSSKRRVR